MSIRLHLRHPLGEETVVRDDAVGAMPLVFGRGRDADVVVPSFAVAAKHCAIFLDVASQRWLVQDGNTRGRTSVNGVALAGSRHPCPLSPGFVISLGDANGATAQATIRVESIGDETFALPAEPIAFPAESEEAGETVEFGMGAINVSRRPRRAARWSGPLLMLAAAAIMLAGVVGVALVVERPNTTQRAVTPSPAPATTTSRPTSRASSADEPPATRPTIDVEALPDPNLETEGERFARLADPAGERGVIAGVSPLDPLRATSAWADVVAAERAGDSAKTLVAYEAFANLPQSRTGDLRYEVLSRLEMLLDDLWWRRVDGLLGEEFAVIDRSLATELRLRSMTGDGEPGEADRLRASLAADRDRLLRISDVLVGEMRHTSGERPDPADAEQLRRLRAERDAAAYATWREGVLAVARRQGRLPWDEESTATTRPR